MTYPVTLTENLALMDAEIRIATDATDGDGASTLGAFSFGRNLDDSDAYLGSNISQAAITIKAGVIGTVTVLLYQSTGSDFSNLAAGDVKVIADKTITLATDAYQGVINLKAEELDTAGGYKFWTWAADFADAGTIGVTVQGADAKYGPASDQNVANTTVVK